MGDGRIKRGISKAAIRRWNEQSYESEKARYDFAVELFQKLREEREQEIAERKAILAEREADEQARIQAEERAEAVKNTASAPKAIVDTTTNKEKVESVKPSTEDKSNKDTQGFWTSLWMGIVDGFKHPVSTSFGTPLVYEHSRSDIEKRDKAQQVYWTKDAVSAYNIQKNKVEILKYTGDIVTNKEKLQYADIINTYTDNVNDYINLQLEYNTIKDDNSLEGRMRKANISKQMNTLKKWIDDLDESMLIATSYKMDANTYNSSITSYEGSIGAPKSSSSSLQEAGKGIYNQFKRISQKAQPTQFDLESVAQTIKKVKLGVNSYKDKINGENAIALKKMDEEYKDLQDWEEWHTPSAEFRAKEKAAQSNYLFDWDTYAYSFPGTLGSSMSFGGVQMLSTALNMGGGVAIQTGNPYLVAGGVAATLTGAGLGILSGMNENKSEVGSNYTDAVRQELDKKGLLEDFVKKGEAQLKKKGLFYHADENDKIEDILNYFVRGDVLYNDQRINEVATKHLFGANNLFQNDMMAVSADVAFDTGLNLFLPAGSVAKALKIAPVGKFNTYTRTLAGISSEHPLIGNIIRRVGAVESGVGSKVLDAVSPIAGGIYRGAKVAVPQLNKIHKGAETFANGMKKGIKNLTSFITDAPASTFKLNTVGKGMLTFGGMSLMRGFSEAIEEGKQYKYGERFKEGGFAGKSNTILETLADDLSTGTSAALAFFGSQFLGIESDSELMSNMRGGFVGGILNHGSAITAYQQANNVMGEMKMGDLFMQNVMLKRVQERGEMINGTQFAKYATNPNKVAQMNAAIDRMIEISERYQDLAQEDPSQQYWTREDIETQRELFNRIVSVANNGFVQASLKRQGIDVDSERGNAAVSLISYGLNKRQEDENVANDHILQFNKLLEQDRLEVDQLGNIRSLVENIDNLDENPGLTTQEIQYLKDLYEEEKASYKKNNPINKKLNSKQRRRAEKATRQEMLDNISAKIKQRVENDKNIDAAFAKHYALLKLKNELESIPEEMRSRTQRNQLKSIKYQLDDFINKLSPLQKILHQVQTEESLANLGKNRGFFQQMSAAFRTVALDNASMMQDEAFLNGMLGKDARLVMGTASATNILLTERKEDKALLDELFDNISDAAKDKTTFEAKREALIDNYLKSVQDDYKLFEQIRDNFQDSLELLESTEENIAQNQAEHTRTMPEQQQAIQNQNTISFDDIARQEARKAKRKRWRENRRRREQAWWNTPTEEQLQYYNNGPVNIDEVQDEDPHFLFGDYLAQYDDLTEEPLWNDLSADRMLADAQDAAFREQYIKENDSAEGHKLYLDSLTNKYSDRAVVSTTEENKRSSYAIVGQRYNDHVGHMEFALQKLKLDESADKRYKTIWVPEGQIEQYVPSNKQISIDFELQLEQPQLPKSINGITVGQKYNFISVNRGKITIYRDVEVLDIDDTHSVLLRTQNGDIFSIKLDRLLLLIKDFDNTIGYLNVTLDEQSLQKISEMVDVVKQLVEANSVVNPENIIKGITGLYKTYLDNKNKVVASNTIDSFVNRNGTLVRVTKASYGVGDMAVDNKSEAERKTSIVALFASNGINNTEHTIRVLEGWYNNTLSEDEKDVISILGKPTDAAGQDLHKNKIDLTPYITLFKEGHFGTTEIEHIAHIVSREYDKPAVSEQDRINNLVYDIVQGRDVEDSKLADDIVNALNSIRKQGLYVLYLPIHIVGEQFSYENNLFVIDSMGNIRSLFFPTRTYDYNERLDEKRLFPEINRQQSQKPVGFSRQGVMTEREWQDKFAQLTSSIVLEYSVPTYKGTYQIPVLSNKNGVVVSDKHVIFDVEGKRIQPLTSAELTKEMKEISSLVEKATKLLNANREILPFTSCIEMLDFCDSVIREFEPNVTTAEEVSSVKYYLDSAINYMAHVVDVYNQQNNPVTPQNPSKSSGKVNVKAEKMLPVIRADVQRVQEILDNIQSYTKAGGYIQKQVRDTLDAFLKNDAMERYEEKLRGSEDESDKELASRMKQLRSSISLILASYPNTISSDYKVDPNTKQLPDNILVLSDTNRLELGNILSMPDFANVSEIELVYGTYDSVNNKIFKLDRKSNSTGAGVYAIITYKGKTYKPVFILPSHYTDRFNTITEKGNAFVDAVIAQQSLGKVIASDVHRILPNVNYNGNMVPVTMNSVLKLTDQDLQKLTPRSTNIGMCKTDGKIFPLNSVDASPIATLNSTNAAKNMGGIFYMLPFNYEEYLDGSSIIPVRLLNQKLKDGDIDVIISILKSIKDRFDLDGTLDLNKEYSNANGVTPFTNIQVLLFLSNFEQNELKSRIFINPDGTVKMRKSTNLPFETPVNPNTSDGEQTIRDFFAKNSPYVFNHVRILSGKLSSTTDPTYKKLSSYIQLNGQLSISPSLMFDEDDVFINGEGFYGIGWALRHGRIVTNAGYLYEPSVGITEVASPENAPVGQYNPQPTAMPQPQQNKPVDNGMDWLENIINNAENNDAVAYSTVVSTNKKLDKEQALKNIRRMLGESVDINIEDTVLDVLDSGAEVVGQCFVDSIILSSQAIAGTEYHESFHRVVELLMNRAERERLYSIYVKKHPQLKYVSTKDIAEHMAESFRIWMTEEKPETFKFTWNIVKLFKQIKNWITAIKRIGSLRLAYAYYKINTGAYANVNPSQENIERFKIIFSSYAPMTVYNATTDKNVELKQFTSISDYNAGIETISRMIINEYLKADNTIEVTDIDLSIEGIKKMSGYNYLVGGETKTAANKAFIELFDNWDNIKTEVIDKLKVLGIGIRQNKATGKISLAKSSLDTILDVDKEDDEKRETNEGAIGEMMDYISKESYEISRVKKIKDFVKFLLSSIEDTHYVEEGEVNQDGEQIPMWVFESNDKGLYIDEDGDPIVFRNGRWECDKTDGQVVVGDQVRFKKHRNTVTSTNVFGFKKYLPFNEVYAKLLADCHSINTISDLIYLLKNKSYNDLMYKQVYDKIITAYNNILYVDKEGFHHDKNGGLWRMLKPENSAEPILLKVDDNKRPIQITEEVAQQRPVKLQKGNKFFLAMSMDQVELQYDWNNVATIVQLFNAIAGSKLNYKMVIANRDAQSAMQYRVSDTDAGYTARKYSLSWYVSFISNKLKVETIESGGVLYHRTKDAQLFDKAHEFFATVANAFVNPKGPTARTGNFIYNGRTYNTFTNTDTLKRMIVQTFNSIGIGIDKKTFDHLLFTTFGDTGHYGLVRYFGQNGDVLGKNKAVNFEFFIKSIQNSQKNGVFQAPLESGAFFMKSGVVGQLADAKYSYNTIHKQLSVNAPGNNRYYVMSEKNTITFMTELISDKDGQTMQDFVNCPYYTYKDPITGVTLSTFILESILSGDYKLVFDNFVGFRNEDIRGDAGSDYMQIQDAVDLISKITILEDNNMIFPIMSNKKTYGHLSLVDKNGIKKQLPGIKFISNQFDSSHTPYKSDNVPTLVSNVYDNQYITNGQYSKYSFVFPDEVYDRLIKYAFMEYETVKYGMKLVDEMPEEDKVDNLHKANRKTKQSSAGICRFPRFYGVYVQEPVKDGSGKITAINRRFINFNDNNKSDAQNLALAESVFFGQHVTNTERKAMINELLMVQLEKWLDYLETKGIVRKRQGWRSIVNPFLRYESNVLDKNLINSIVISQQKKLDGKTLSANESRSLAIVQLLMDAHIKHQISMEEIQRLYVGHPGEFETEYDNKTGRIVNDEKDLSKRLGGLASTGETNAIGVLGLSTDYVCSEMDDYVISSPQAEDFKAAFNESESRFTLFNTDIKQIDSLLSNFRLTGVEHTDLDNLDKLCQSIYDIVGENNKGVQDLSDKMAQLIFQDWDKSYSKNVVVPSIRTAAKEVICTELHKDQAKLSLEEVSKQLEKRGLLSGVQARAGAYASSYEHGIKVGDGASYISPKMCKNLLMQLGLFKGKVVKAFNYLERGISRDILSDAEACSTIMGAMLGTQKYTAYGYRMSHGFPEFYYNKMALFPMFRQLCVTPKLKGVYDMMTKGDEPIDMLMFKSAVKVGSKGSQAIPEFSSDFDNFKPNTYKQKFRFLIKQLNTDPKDREKMAMGTQALKVIESILNVYVTDYQRRKDDGTLSDTDIVSGKDLRDEIMSCRKNIANIQISNIIKRFYDESGAKNEKEFVKWIKNALTERDASVDMLKALQLNEDGTRKTKLSGMSDGGWVQSIVTTLINKECIDLNLPGNMFIQRSVFGMEGRIVADKYVPSINNGERLKLVNEQGSMDSVISIDYFVEMFPELKKMSFKQQRQWLLDKKIIGKDAKALCVSYRIPTQAASSISALRFVDVLPIVRDTIVLPEEFTALTGSDFDIDKLFFSMKNIYIGSDGVVHDEFDKGSLEYYQNLLIEDFITLLQQDRNKVGNVTLRSIDNDTEIGKAVAEELTSGTVAVDPYDALSLWRQSQIKEQNRTGGEAVGPSALNNSSQNIGRMYDLHLANTGVVRQLGISDLSSDLDIDSRSVLGLLGAYINGAVDNAKDPWISIVGLSSYTYNLANTLARAGFGRNTLYFTAQPVVKELAKIHAYAESSLFRDQQQTAYEIERQLVQDFENTYFLGAQGGISQEAKEILSAMNSPMAKFIESYDVISEKQAKQFNLINRSYAIIKAILGIDNKDPHIKLNSFTRVNGDVVEGSIMRDVAIMYSVGDTSKALTDHIKRYTINIKYSSNTGVTEESIELSPNEVEMYMYILTQLLEYPSSAVSNSVQYTKIDTKKQGKNTAEQFAFLHGYNQLKASKAFDSSLIDMLEDSYIEQLTVGTIQLHQKILSDEYIEAMNPMADYYSYNWIDQFLSYCGSKINAKSVKAAVDGIASYVKYKYIQDYAEQIRVKQKELFIGDNSIYNQLEEIKTTILENPVLYKEYVDGDGNINNVLLDSLEPAYIREKDFDNVRNAPKFVEIVQKEDEDGNSVNALRMAWEQMLNDDKHKDIQSFAKRLIIYGFLTSGDTNRPGTIFKYVPFSWRYQTSKLDGMQQSYSEYIASFIEDGNRMHEEAKLDSQRSAINILPERRNSTIYDEILLNNWNDPSLVPTIPENKSNKKYYKTLTLNSQVGNPDILIAAEMSMLINKNGVVQHVIQRSSVNGSPSIVKLHKEGHTSYNQEDFYFYRRYSYGTSVDRYGNVFSYPIYTLVNPRGGVFYGNRIIEYMTIQGYDWNDREEFVDESKLAEIEKIVSVWNDSIKITPPQGVNKRDWEIINANTYLTLDSIGSDENSVLTLLCASMALYDSFRRQDRLYKSEKYTNKIDKSDSKIKYSNGQITRKEILNNPRTLYIFTDNTNRTSGSNKISRNSKYYKMYGDGQNDLFYPSKTRAIARGLDNALPISTQRYYDPQHGLVKETGRWKNEDLDEFKKVIDAEFDNIELEWASGNYDNIVILGESLFNSDISDISKSGDRSEIYNYLNSRLTGLFLIVDGVSNTEQYYYPGKPTLNSIPNWQPGSIYYAGVGSRETPQDVMDNMTELAKELEKDGYVLRSGGAVGADTAFSNGVSSPKNKKIYFLEDIEHDVYGTAEQAKNVTMETHPALDKVKSDYAKNLLYRDAYQVFGERLDSPVAFVICWTNDGVTSYEQTTATTGGTGQAIRIASRKGIPVINMKDPDWRQKLDDVLLKNKPQESIEVWFGTNGRGPNADLSNMANRPFILSDASIQRLNEIFKGEGESITISEVIQEQMNGEKFVGVEQAFLMTKLAALYMHVRQQPVVKRLRKNATQEEIERNSQLKLTSEERTTLLDNIKFAMRKVADAKTNKEAKSAGRTNIGDVYGIVDEFFNGIWNNKDGKPDPTTGSYKAMGVLQIASFQQNEKSANKLVNTGNKRFTHEKGGDWATAFPQVLTITRNYMRNHPTKDSAPVIRTELIIADSSSKQDMDRAAAAVGGIVTTRQHGEKYHFGNPFSHNSAWGIVTGDGTIADAVKAFDSWLAGTEHQDVEPERRQWILDMINSGMLDNTPLVYYMSNATDKTGTHAYNYNTFPNHAHILLKYINMHIANPLNSVEQFASPLEAKATIESEKTILTNQELAEWNAQGVTNPRILVASEHTDPAFFADQIVDIIEGRRKAAGYGQSANKYTGKDFNALYIITKHDGAPIRKILNTKIPKIVHFSVTGLGGTVWEPNVMPYSKMLDKIQQLIKDGLDPNCVTIRIDPIVPGVTLVSTIEDIIKRSAQMGIKRIRFSVCDMYRGNTVRLPDGRTRVKPAAWIPALERTEQQQGKEAKDKLWKTLVEAYGVDQQKPYLLNFNAYPQRIYNICEMMANLGEKYGITLSTCAEGINHPKISKEGCLSVAQVNEILGTSIEDKGEANNTFRQHCSCFGGKVDALEYSNDCSSICGYCYAGHANDDAISLKIEQTKDAQEILKFDKEALKQMGAEVLKYCNKFI